MNTSFKKALCLSLILGISAPISAGWFDYFRPFFQSITRREVGIFAAGAALCAALAVLKSSFFTQAPDMPTNINISAPTDAMAPAMEKLTDALTPK